jgi:cell division transport system ATP-binding protein
MLKFEKVTKIYFLEKNKTPIVALSNVSFEIKEKEFVSIIGKSGAGKSTLLKLIAKEEEPTSGKIFFDGKDITHLNNSEIPLLRRQIGIIFQNPKFLQKRTVFENVKYVLEALGKKDEEIERDVPMVLEIVGLADKINSLPVELSAGEKQKLSIAQALIHRPKVVLADEPTGNLDPYNTLDIINLLLKINEMGTTVILATHNKEIVNRLKKRVIYLEKGKIIRDEDKGSFIL